MGHMANLTQLVQEVVVEICHWGILFVLYQGPFVSFLDSNSFLINVDLERIVYLAVLVCC